jgi:hypothetical protein
MAEAKQLKNNEFHVIDQKHEINRELDNIDQFSINFMFLIYYMKFIIF